MKRWLVLVLSLLASPASANPVRIIDAPRITVGQVVKAPAVAADVDLGPAPPPGGSRLVTREELRRQLKAAGIDPDTLRLPRVVRVESAARRIEPKELRGMVDAAIRRTLPKGVDLATVKPSSSIVVSPRAVVGSARVPKLPRRAGRIRSTATVEFLVDGEAKLHLPVPIVVDVSSEAAVADVPRGMRTTLVIERRTARVATAGIALADADVGDTIAFRVTKTGRIVRAKVISRQRARVVEAP